MQGGKRLTAREFTRLMGKQLCARETTDRLAVQGMSDARIAMTAVMAGADDHKEKAGQQNKFASKRLGSLTRWRSGCFNANGISRHGTLVGIQLAAEKAEQRDKCALKRLWPSKRCRRSTGIQPVADTAGQGECICIHSSDTESDTDSKPQKRKYIATATAAASDGCCAIGVQKKSFERAAGSVKKRRGQWIASLRNGLNTKGDIKNIPEVQELIDQMEKVALTKSDPTTLARAFLLLQLIRGMHGVRWCGRELLNSEVLREHLCSDFLRCITILSFRYKIQCRTRKSKTWAAHAEGRHTGQSGGHPLLALLHYQKARDAFIAAAESIATVLSNMLQQHTLTPTMLLQVCKAVRKKSSPWLAYRATGKRPGPRTVGLYNSMNIGRVFALWAEVSGRVSPVALDETTYSFMMKGQTCADELSEQYGVHTAADFQALLAAAPQPMPWQLALVSLCELRQCRDAVGDDDLERALKLSQMTVASLSLIHI